METMSRRAASFRRTADGASVSTSPVQQMPGANVDLQSRRSPEAFVDDNMRAPVIQGPSIRCRVMFAEGKGNCRHRRSSGLSHRRYTIRPSESPPRPTGEAMFVEALWQLKSQMPP